MPRISLPLYPWAIRRLKKTFVHCSLSVSEEHIVKIQNKVLYTIPGSSPSGWAKCKYFLNRVVSMLFELLMVIVMSMKSTVFDSSLNSHVRPENAFILCLNSFHSCVSSCGFLFGHHIPMTLSMNLL